MKIAIVLGLAIGCCGSVAADTLLTYTRESPEIVMPSGPTRGGKEAVRILVGDGRVRLEEGNRLTILRQDEKKLYLVGAWNEKKKHEETHRDPDGKLRTEKWSGPRTGVAAYPVDLRKELPAETYAAVFSDPPAPPLTARSIATGKTRKIGRWTASEHRIELVDASGQVQDSAVVWTTAELPDVHLALVHELRTSLAALSPRPRRLLLAQEIEKLPGVPVRIEADREELMGQMHTTLELQSVADKAATEADYLPPKEAEKDSFFTEYLAVYHDL
ncbi:MAG TPA: hypothetical protein VGE98_10490 [Thermoanaerobaculia bacterium]